LPDVRSASFVVQDLYGDAELTPGQLRSSKKCSRTFLVGLLIFILLLPGAIPSEAYSVLTHEAIIGSAWEDAIWPSLQRRFLNATPEDLKIAHAFAYGGCTIQDLGYYPYGSRFFSDLVHYIRSGDFMEALLRDSRDINKYAFALGALAHYAADNNGHRMAVNRAVAILYPGLRGLVETGQIFRGRKDSLGMPATPQCADLISLCGRYGRLETIL
jgi:hypothetical protein